MAKSDDVKGLKKMAETKVAAALEKPIINAYVVLFLSAISIVYNRMPDTDRELCNLVIAHAQKHSELISVHPSFKAAMLESGAFVAEVFSKAPPPPPDPPYIGHCTRCKATDKWKLNHVTCSYGWGECCFAWSESHRFA